MNKDTKLLLWGDRLIATQDIKQTGLTIWSAPYTGSFECMIPTGTIFLVKHDQIESASKIDCVPEKYKELEKILVPTTERYHLKYSGYYFLFSTEDVGTNLELVSRANPKARKIHELKKSIRNCISNSILLQAIMGLFMFIIVVPLIPLKPFINSYRQKKLDSMVRAEQQNKGA